MIVAVSILSPNAAKPWRLQWTDPDTGKVKRSNIPPEHRSSVRKREAYRTTVEKKVNERAAELGAGALPLTGTPLQAAVDRYFVEYPTANETTYRLAIGYLVEHLAGQGLAGCDDVTAETLGNWRAAVLTGKKKNGEPWSQSTIATRLRKAQTILIRMHKRRWLPSITRDEIRDICERPEWTGESTRKRGKRKKATPARAKRKPILKPDELRELFAALERYDAHTFGETERTGTPGRKRRGEPLAPFYAFLLLTGLRREEALALTWDEVGLSGDAVLDCHEDIAKGGRPRKVWLDLCPTAAKILRTRKLQTGGPGYVFPFTPDECNAMLRTLRREPYNAPPVLDNKAIRRTCASYLVNAPSIGVHRAAKQLGHSIDTAEKHYWELVRGIDPDARTVEEALACKLPELPTMLADIVDAMSRRRPRKPKAA